MSARKHIMLGTAGHVDHGKTALVKMLTGCNLDTLAEEQQRGMTIDLGFAPCHLDNDRVVGVVDVPGHADFIRNMVAGAHGIDVVIFVVAADDGVMPQTREHLNILTLMGLQRGVVVLTKIDLVASEHRERVIAELRRLLAGTFLETASICPLSTITGEGFEGFFTALNAVVDACEERPCNGLFHLWVEDVFSPRGAGTVITGIPTNGIVRVGDAVCLIPGGQTGRVRRLQVYGEDSSEGRAGECVALNLAELDHQGVRRGMVLCHPQTMAPVELIEAHLQLLPSFRGELKDFAEVHLHLGTAAVTARVVMLEQPRLAPGQAQSVQLRLAQPLGVMAGERYVIRTNEQGAEAGGLVTAGGGRVLGVSNVKLRRHRQWVLEALAARRAALDSPLAWCEVNLRQAAQPLTAAELARACQYRLEEVTRLLGALHAGGAALSLPGDRWVHRANVRAHADALLERIQAFHAAHAERLGIEREELRKTVNLDPAVFDLAVKLLADESRIVPRGTVLAAAGWQAKVTSEEDRLCEQIAELFKQAKWTPPAIGELAVTLKQPLKRTEHLVQLLVERGVLQRVAPELVLHGEAIEAAKRVALALFAKAPSFSTMDFRDALGVSRKYAVPLLDYLDSIRFTVRSGNVRTPGAEARKAKAKAEG